MWNLSEPEFTFGNRVELELEGFIEVLELGLNQSLILKGLKIEIKLVIWFQVLILVKTRLNFHRNLIVILISK
jgi:hypothetical protein